MMVDGGRFQAVRANRQAIEDEVEPLFRAFVEAATSHAALDPGAARAAEVDLPLTGSNQPDDRTSVIKKRLRQRRTDLWS
jgi:hypothetical protein